MKKLGAMVAVLMVILGTAGCTPGGGPSSDPPWSPTPIVWPTPPMTDEEKGSVDAVQKYLEVSNDIEQHLADADWNRIRDVATEPAVNDALIIWTQWNSKGWHMEGTPIFELNYVNSGMMNSEGNRYHVNGCLVITDTRLVDRDGNQVGDRRSDRNVVEFLVLRRASDGAYRVMENVLKDGTC